MNKKIYFVSDAHFGAATHAGTLDAERKFCRWLDSVKHDAEAIYLMGDIFDYWFEYKYVVPKGFTRVLGKIAEITDAGVDVHFFIGNHDLWLTDYLSTECGMITHFEPLIADIYGKKFFLAHGDGLGDESKSFHFLRKVFHNKFLRRCFSAIHPRWTMPLAHSWSARSRRNGEIYNFMGEEKEHLIKFSKSKLSDMSDINYFVYGHRHILLDYPLSDSSNVIILGDWITIFSYAEFDGKEMKLKIWED